MGLFARFRAAWSALTRRPETETEDDHDHVIELAETRLQKATEKLKEARTGLVSYRALVLKVQQQVESEKARIMSLTEEIQSHLSTGKEELAARLALKLSRVKTDVAANERQCEQHRQSYESHLLRMKAALKDIETANKQLEKKKAALQLENALAEVSETAEALDAPFDVATDIGSILMRVDDRILDVRARNRVASDLAEPGTEERAAKMEGDESL
jgi:phage shock protein A